MQAIKLKACIGTGAILEWLEPLPDLPTGEVEIIVLPSRRGGGVLTAGGMAMIRDQPDLVSVAPPRSYEGLPESGIIPFVRWYAAALICS